MSAEGPMGLPGNRGVGLLPTLLGRGESGAKVLSSAEGRSCRQWRDRRVLVQLDGAW